MLACNQAADGGGVAFRFQLKSQDVVHVFPPAGTISPGSNVQVAGTCINCLHWQHRFPTPTSPGCSLQCV